MIFKASDTGWSRDWRLACRVNLSGEALMASARDQAARIVRSEPDQAGGEDSVEATAALADQRRSHVAAESGRGRGKAPRAANPAPGPPPASAPQAATAKPGRK